MRLHKLSSSAVFPDPTGPPTPILTRDAMKQPLRLEQPRLEERLLMAADVERGGAGGQHALRILDRAIDGADDPFVRARDQFLCLRRADRHAADRRRHHAARQALAVGEEELSEFDAEPSPCHADDDGMVWRI